MARFGRLEVRPVWPERCTSSGPAKVARWEGETAEETPRNLDAITRFGRGVGTTLLVVNGPSLAGLGLGLGGQGYLSYSIATPTGDGMTSPLTFTRYHRVMLTDTLRMI
jgi:hypothetical protein